MKTSLHQHIVAYKEQIALGSLPQAYQGLMQYMMHLRTHFKKQYPDDYIVGNFYQGYMDMSYFPVTPKALKRQKLKVGIVFNHENFNFEIWLLGQNKQTQKHYWELLQQSDWETYPISTNPHEAIIQHCLIANPNFEHLDVLTQKIEREALAFIQEIAKTFALKK